MKTEKKVRFKRIARRKNKVCANKRNKNKTKQKYGNEYIEMNGIHAAPHVYVCSEEHRTWECSISNMLAN